MSDPSGPPTQSPPLPESDGESDDFGSFDEASFDDFVDTPEPAVDTLIDNLFPHETDGTLVEDPLLSERSQQIYEELSRVPHLQPPNWTRLNIRHNLLIKLGIPINLDEISRETKTQPRRKSVNEADIDWGSLVLPDFNEINDPESLIASTHDVLSRVEAATMSHTSQQYLQSCSEETLQAKLHELTENLTQLRALASVWCHKLDEKKKNFEVYELVVQNLIGYSQRVRRDEILSNLKAGKHKKLWK